MDERKPSSQYGFRAALVRELYNERNGLIFTRLQV